MVNSLTLNQNELRYQLWLMLGLEFSRRILGFDKMYTFPVDVKTRSESLFLFSRLDIDAVKEKKCYDVTCSGKKSINCLPLFYNNNI